MLSVSGKAAAAEGISDSLNQFSVTPDFSTRGDIIYFALRSSLLFYILAIWYILLLSILLSPRLA